MFIKDRFDKLIFYVSINEMFLQPKTTKGVVAWLVVKGGQDPFLGLPLFLTLACNLNLSTIFSCHGFDPKGVPLFTEFLIDSISFSVNGS